MICLYLPLSTLSSTTCFWAHLSSLSYLSRAVLFNTCFLAQDKIVQHLFIWGCSLANSKRLLPSQYSEDLDEKCDTTSILDYQLKLHSSQIYNKAPIQTLIWSHNNVHMQLQLKKIIMSYYANLFTTNIVNRNTAISDSLKGEISSRFWRIISSVLHA